MATLSRVTGKLFGGNAPLEEIGQFGSAKAGSPLNTQDVATIQALPAYANGWGSAIMTSRNFPPIEEVTGVLKTLSYQNCYLLQEGAPVYDINTNYSATSIVKVVSGTNLSFYISLQDNNLGHSLSDANWWVKASFSERNLGELVTSLLPLTDASLHLLDGSLLSGSGIYANFVSYIASIYNSSLNYFTSEANWQSSVSTYGVCGKFVYNSTNNTVRLPKVTGFVEGTIDITALGNLVKAGLPNHSHTVALKIGREDGDYGSFDTAYNHSSTVTLTTSLASASNSIYGASSTVQPQSIKGFMYIVVATATKTNIQVDIDEIATDLNGKADTDLSNANNTAKILISNMAMPSTGYVNLTLGASGAEYTAPSNGWFTISKRSAAVGQYISITNKTTKLSAKSVSSIAEQQSDANLPVKKGDKVNVTYSATGNLVTFRFIYAVGSESEA